MQLVAGDPDRRQHSNVSAVLQGNAQRSRPQLHLASRRLDAVEHQSKRLALSRRLTLNVQEVSGVRYRIENDQEFGRELQGQDSLLAGRQLQRLKSDLLNHLLI